MLTEFKKFIQRGNVLDLAVAVIIGAAFGKIITTLVDGVIMPPIGLLLGKVDFASLLLTLDSSKGRAPVSLADAKARGIPVIAYGQLINDIINFLIIALVVFLVVRFVAKLRGPVEPPPATRDCPRCLSKIPALATRCSHCAVDLVST